MFKNQLNVNLYDINVATRTFSPCPGLNLKISAAHRHRNDVDWQRLGRNGVLVVTYTDPTTTTHGHLRLDEYGVTGNRATDLATLRVSYLL